MENGASNPPDTAGAVELRAELERVTRERDQAISARDALVGAVLAGSSSGETRPAGPGKPRLAWAVAFLLLAGIAVLVLQVQLTWTRRGGGTERLGAGAPPSPQSAGARSAAAPISPRRLVTIPVTELSQLTRAALSPDGALLAVGGLDGKVGLLDLGRDRMVRLFQAHTSGVRALAFTPDGRNLVSGAADGQVHLWGIPGGARQATLRKPGPAVRGLALGKGWVAVAAEQPEVELIPLEVAQKDRRARRLAGHTDWVRAVAFSADGALLASAGHDGAIRLWSVSAQGAKARGVLPGHRLWVGALAISPDGKRLASGGFDRRIRIWDLANSSMIRQLRGHVRWIADLAFDRRGVQLASASPDRTVRVWNVSTGQATVLEGHLYQVHSVAFHPRAKLLASASTDGTVRLWPLPPPTPRNAAALPPPGPGEITLRSYTTGERLRVRLVDEQGNVLEQGRQRLAWILRSGPDDRASPPVPELVRLLYKVADHFGRKREVVVISGYRSPEYNELRTRQSRQVGKESRHMKGEAMDLRIDGVSIVALHRYLRKLRAGGVGYYPDSHFVHIDIGPPRHWQGD